MDYEAAVALLYQAPHSEFVATRKRLASELKAAGDKDGAARLGKLGRPAISCWAVNQLWWQAREDFEDLFTAAARLRAGDRDAAKGHREALATLRNQAANILSDAGHAATEATLRRISTTLSSLAAVGGFEPDIPGALVADREPVGFEIIMSDSSPDARGAESKTTSSRGARAETRDHAAEQRRLQEARARERAEAERRRIEEERAKRQAEQEALESALRKAQDELASREREIELLRTNLSEAERDAAVARKNVTELAVRLAALRSED